MHGTHLHEFKWPMLDFRNWIPIMLDLFGATGIVGDTLYFILLDTGLFVLSYDTP